MHNHWLHVKVKKEMDIFKDTDSMNIPLVEYVSWFIDEKNEKYNSVQLPPIQRNVVWKVSQIERIWDSILRGFPIGSFLLSNREKGVKSRIITQKEQKISEDDGFFLLDGQQRTRAILLGFTHTENARLWIDLDPQLSFDNAAYNDRQFLFRVTTSHQPWGMKCTNPDEKLSELKKYDARNELYQITLHYDYQVKINIPKNKNVPVSWPIDAKWPIPFDELVKLCGGYSKTFHTPEWDEIIQFIPEIVKIKKGTAIEKTEHFSEIIRAVKRIIDCSKDNNALRSISLLKYNGDFKSCDDDNAQESIEVLFRRINAGGTVLAGEEMQYSLLKASWDEAYEIVSKIVDDEKIGYLFSPTGIVLSAARLARYNNDETDTATPTIADFRRWIGSRSRDGKKSFLDEMKDLLKEDNKSNQSVYHSVIDEFCKAVIFNDQFNNDIGLPRKLLLSINTKFYHPVIIWIYLNLSNRDKIKNNRLAILRYMTFALIGFNNPEKVSKKAIEIIKEANDSFPDRKIYKECLNNVLAINLPTVDQFELTIKTNKADGFFREEKELFGQEDDTFREFRYRFWYKKELLLWFQRKYHSKWFQGYNPMSDDSFDTPYDYDHILPYSHLITQGGSITIDFEDKEKKDQFLGCRWRYINSIANYRAWPSWANRSDKNKCHIAKLRLESEEIDDSDSEAKELQLKSDKEFLEASGINPEDKQYWKKAGGRPRDWNQERRINWQIAIENRVVFLYKKFYNSFQFQEWTNETQKSV